MRIRAGVRAGLLAAAATGGAVIGFGMRRSGWSGPFDALGSQVLLGLGFAPSNGVLPVAVGLAAHASWMVIWGIIFVVLTRGAKPATTVVYAVLLGLGVAVVARSLVPAAFGAVQFAFLPAIQAVLCVLLLAGGLVAGRALSRTDSTTPQKTA
jgi:hypothetical protein